MNELAVHWVAEKSWTYRCEFKTPAGSQGRRTAIVFEGLDTLAKVQLNGRTILSSDNMFISHRVDITADLRADAPNTIEIEFDSALLRAREIRKEHPEHNYIAHQGELDRLGVRKAAYNWGWDWGPRLMTAGPWRPVYLETYDSRIEDTFIEYVLDKDLQLCKGVVSARVDGRKGDQILLVLRSPDGELVFESRCTVGDNSLVQAEFVLQSPSLWYPHGYGAQPRYLLEASLLESGLAVHQVVRKIGFRKAELVQEVDIHGKSFYFRINGIDVFAGGSCWIPADNFVPRISPERYRKWLELMVEGNQVMTR